MEKMLYIMGIEWDWIFQRPQIFALELQKDYEVTVVCPKQPIKGKRQQNQPPERLKELIQIPLQEKVKWIGGLADGLHRKILKDIDSYDLVWVGYPLFGRYIPEDYQGTVIYDCMDNFEALYPDQRKKAIDRVLAMEERLLKRADIVFASSCKLRDKLREVCPEKNIEIVRNGYRNITVRKPWERQKKEQYVLSYIGTISEWFDSDVVAASLEACKKVRYELTGPVSRHRQIRNPGVTYMGVVEHKELGKCVERADCLIMPFRITEIVQYVDPVKLYEYIAFGKCIIASWYPEIDRFGEFVYFYHDQEEYLYLINLLVEQGFPAKYTPGQQKAFLSENTWEKRIESVKRAIKQRTEV